MLICLVLFALATAGCRRQIPASAGVVAAGELADADAPEVRAAAEALANGRPWHATELLTPLLRDSTRRTPRVVFLAARAAGAWGGWTEVERLLRDADWPDSTFDGRARALLARALLERGADSSAVHEARRALVAAPEGDDTQRAERLVLLARAYQAADAADSARAAYERAARALPEAADWLRLRAAALSTDSASRAADYAALRTAITRASVPAVEAAALLRAGDSVSAARAYERLGRHADALRLRLAMTSDASDRAAMRRALVRLVRERRGTGEARAATAALDASFPSLGPDEQLAIARSAAVAGPASRAAKGFARALAAGHGTTADHFTYAGVLSRLGRDAAAAREYAKVRRGSLAGRAAYLRARSLLRAGRGREARAALRQVVARHSHDARAAADALFLLGDLATDAHDDRAARARFRELARRYPTSRRAPRAELLAALIALAGGSPARAAAELDSLPVRHPASDEVNAALYWSGRARAAAGDSARAVARWREVVERSPRSYYAVLAARRLGERPWIPAPATDDFVHVPDADTVLARTALLQRLGLEREARAEYAHLAAAPGAGAERLLALADAFRDHGLPWRGITLAQRAVAHGAARDARTYRLLYPLAPAGVLAAQARERGLDPALVAALVRQESRFRSGAVSRAGAVGLMQLMPRVGRTLAAAVHFPVWETALLRQPDVNLRLGTTHLAELIHAQPDPARALAAYNAGASRVARWSTKRGASDPELFVERVPYVETRDYVRIIERDRALYRALYADAVAP